MAFSRQEYWSRFSHLLQRRFPTQASNPGLLYCRQFLYHLSYLTRLGTTQMNWKLKSTQKPSCGCYFHLTQNWQNLKVTEMLFSWWINKWTVWFIQTRKHYSALKVNELPSHKKTWENLNAYYQVKEDNLKSCLYDSNYATFWRQ